MDEFNNQGLTMLLQTIITGQRETDKKLDAAVERMATKDDIGRLVDSQEKFVYQADYDKLELRVKDLEENRLPKWFWPVVTLMVMLAAPAVAHFWR